MSNIDQDLKLKSYPPCDLKLLASNSIICYFCKRIIVYAHQTDDCGCRFCFECLDELINKQVVKCPKCNLVIASSFKIPDKFFHNKIEQTLVKCIASEDCDWRGLLVDYSDHYNSHFKIVKKNKQNMCLTSNSSSHHDLKISQSLLTDNKIECQYKEYGCKFECNYMEASTLESHMHEHVSSHLTMVLAYYKAQLDLINETYFSDDDTQSDSNLLLIKRQRSNSYAPDSDDDSDRSILENKLTILENTTKGLSDDLTLESNANVRLKEENAQLKQTVDQLKTSCIDLHKYLAQSQLSSLKLEERLIILDKTSSNRVLMWRINDFVKKRADPLTSSFYSPAFYTSGGVSGSGGYRCCAKIYFNGDGSGKGTHVSIYLVILKGDYDSLMAWPFRQKVTFSLMDQTFDEKSKNTITYTFMPDEKAVSSFRRPLLDMNVPSGIAQFVSIDTLTNHAFSYVKDDSLFIKISI